MKASGFKQWLQDTMGLDASTIGPTVVDRAVQERVTACGCDGLAEYWSVLRASPLEQQELIEAVVVPETWFFRDTEAFAALVRTYDLAWADAHPGVPLRLLSLPCATGEEPYTMVMALLDAGFPPERIEVDAFDISERALAKAQRGRYGNNSFRGRELQFRDRHFQAVTGGWQIAEAVRRRVRFHQGNVLDIGFLPGQAVYDAVFCRNLLIYFDQDTQIRTVDVLSRLLRPDGLLFVGPSETGLLLSLEFVSAQMPMAFAFRKPGRAPEVAAAAPVTPTASSTTRPLAPSPARSRAAPVRPRLAPAPRPAPALATATEPSLLDRAQHEADNGRFEAAAAACEAHLQKHGPSARAWYLLGLICGASGRRARAEDCFRKALYLEPGHEEALMHLALLLEAKGDADGGRVLRARAQRHRRSADA